MRASDVNWNFEVTSGALPEGPWVNPDDVVFFFSDTAQVCETPLLPRRCPANVTFWQMVLAVPSELVRPGVISLADNRIKLWAQGNTPGCAQNVANINAADEWIEIGATLELVPNGEGLTVKLSGGFAPFGTWTLDGVKGPAEGVVADGEYTATLCGTVPLDPPPSPAIALYGADSPPLPGNGATPEADALVVFVGTLPDSCEDPLAAVDCSWESRLRFTIPAALQTPGVLSLSDPKLAATVTARSKFGSNVCVSAPTMNGTVEILSVDASGVTFKVFESHTFLGDVYPSYSFDGLYSAPICP
jgi:hypothetical protein